MSSADKDGRVAQVFADLHACHAMAMHEALIVADANLRATWEQMQNQQRHPQPEG